MTTLYLLFKTMHISSVVAWFAGLFYIVRLFVYAAEADLMHDPVKRTTLLDQFLIMKRRLWYGITWPAGISTIVFGLGLLHFQGGLSRWIVIKLVLVGILCVYHLSCGAILKQQSAGIYKYSSSQLRMWNEVPTVLLIAIVFIAVAKDLADLSEVLRVVATASLLLVVAFISLRRFFGRKKIST